jgi:hypothetical protein
MQTTPTVSDLLRMLVDSLHEVRGGDEKALPLAEVEAAGFLVYRAMTQGARCYHDLSHLFVLAHELPALGRLAAIYHDVVYLSVDGGISPEVTQRIGDVVVWHEGRVVLSDVPDEMVLPVAMIFGYTPGQEIPQEGLSEFLSAVLALRELRPYLGDHDLWAVAACIEATIPFRAMVHGKSADAWLGERLRAMGSLSEEQIDAIQILAVRMANADVMSFGKPDFGQFIDNTWEILAETNGDFQAAGGYSIRTYREALVRMERFFSTLDPEVIWRRHGDVPDDETFRTMASCSRRNLQSALAYLKAYLAALSVLEALAVLTGGDGPIADFVGDAPMLANSNLSAWHGNGRRFDRALLPLVVSVYEVIRRNGAEELRERVREVHAGHRDWRWFMEGVPKEVASLVGKVITQSTVTRKALLDPWING